MSAEEENVVLVASESLEGISALGERVVLWTKDTLYVSENAAHSLQRVALPEALAIAAATPLRRGLAVFSADGKALRFDGKTWKSMDLESSSWVGASASDSMVAAVDACSRLFVSFDDGLTWVQRRTPAGAIHALATPKGDEVWVAGSEGLFGSTTGGQDWSSWITGQSCEGLAARGANLAVGCGQRLYERAGEGLVLTTTRPYPRMSFDDDGRLLLSFQSNLMRLDFDAIERIRGNRPIPQILPRSTRWKQ